MSSLGSPAWCSMRMNCSMQIATRLSTCTVGRLPMKRAEHACSAQISSGKLKGVITDTPPNGMRMPTDVWPG